MNEYQTMAEFELRQIRAEKIDSMNELHNSVVNEKRDMSAKENNEWQQMKDEIKDIDIVIREKELSLQKANEFILDKNTIRSKDFQRNMNRLSPKSNLFGKIAIAKKKGDEEYRNITSTVATNTIPSEVIQQLFYSAMAVNPLADAGVQYRELDNNSKFPYIDNYPTTHWISSQGDSITADSNTSIGAKDVAFKDLAIKLTVQDAVLYDSALDMERILQTAMSMAINDQVLYTFFHGSGSSGQPTGLSSVSGVNTVSNGDANLSNYDKLVDAFYELVSDNVAPGNISMISHPSVWRQINRLKATDNQPLMAPSGIASMPQYYSSKLLSNLGAGGTNTTAFMGDFSQAIIGYGGPYLFSIDENKNKLQSTYIMHLRVDYAFLQPDHFCTITDILSTIA